MSMAITLGHLCKYAKETYGMKQICGENSMNNLVNWVHMLEDPETAGFLHGQELIFTTGIGHANTEWLTHFVKGLVNRHAIGLVINIGPYIPSVPEELIECCKSMHFPLFTIPWATRIVDITHDFCRQIINGEENEITVAGAFRNAIFFAEKTSEYCPILERKEFDLYAEFCIIAISLHVPFTNKLIEYEKIVRLHLQKILFGYSDRFSIFRQDKLLIVVLQSFPLDTVENALDRLKEVCNYGDENYWIRAGISDNEAGISSLAKNYKRAISVLQIAEKQNKNKVSYRNLGLYQLLIEVEETQVLKRFYEETLGRLEDYDEKNNTDYLATLKCYLYNSASVQEVAKETYVHRNTINYKMKKIKDILQSDINYEDGLKLILAFNIKEII
jgi:DNA-binding PucR family transcriptional regulator